MSEAMKSLKSLMPAMREHAAVIRRALAGLNVRIDQLQAERVELLKQPITREDYAALIHADIDRLADGYRELAAGRMRELMGPDAKPCAPANVQTALGFANRAVSSVYGSLRSPFNDFDGEPLPQAVATFLFRDEMKRGATEAVNAIKKWPFPNAKPLGDSLARMAQIDGELADLKAQRAEFVDQSGALGLDVPAPPPADDGFTPFNPLEARDWEPTRENGYVDPNR